MRLTSLSESLSARTLPAAVAAGLLFAGGALLGPLSDDASRASRPGGAEGVRATAGEGVLLASLGGLRTFVADAFWLRAYVMWERRDRAGCSLFARTACSLAPETPYFRTGYANWLAFDFPHWTLRESGGYGRVPAAEREARHRRDALAALKFLEDEMARDPREPSLPLLASEVAHIKLKDRGLAASYSRRAAETPAAPWRAVADYVGYLDADGRRAEAFRWLDARGSRRPVGSPDPVLSYAAFLWSTGQKSRAVSWLRDYAQFRPPGSARDEALRWASRMETSERSSGRAGESPGP